MEFGLLEKTQFEEIDNNFHFGAIATKILNRCHTIWYNHKGLVTDNVHVKYESSVING